MENTLKVFVLNMRGQPLMPCSPPKARKLLRAGKAVPVRRTPFVIQLTVPTGETKQPITLGVDAGYKHVGLSATTAKEELLASEVELRQDVTGLLSDRLALRRARRNRKTRYRAPRFDNRVRSKHKGWLAPSVENRIQAHISRIEAVCRVLPITKIVIETASFDIQKIKNPEIEGEGYQQGEQLGFWNVREYVLFRDGHVCQACKGRSKDLILNVHHIESRKTGGDAPGNLITLCEACHKAYHAGKLKQFSPRRGASFRAETFMGIMRWTVLNRPARAPSRIACHEYLRVSDQTQAHRRGLAEDALRGRFLHCRRPRRKTSGRIPVSETDAPPQSPDPQADDSQRRCAQAPSGSVPSARLQAL